MKRRPGAGETKVKAKPPKPQARGRNGHLPASIAPAKAAPSKIALPHATAPRPLGPTGTTTSLAHTQDIESAFDLWQEHREHHRAALARLEDERRKLSQQGEFVVGMVRAARGASSEALAVPTQLDAYHQQAADKLEAAKAALEEQAAASAKKWDEIFAEVRKEVRARVDRTLKHVHPMVRLRVRSLAGDKRILHVDRPGADEAVLLCVLFTGRLPSRYGFLFDDMTDDLQAAPPTMYAEEGVQQVRPDAAALAALLAGNGEVLPLKAMLVLQAGGAVARLVERGPVMEAEIAEAAGFRNILTRDESEQIAGYLLKLKLDGAIDLELIAE
jgi:hypothetical protein